MPSPNDNSLTASFQVTGPADQIAKLNAAIKQIEKDYPGVKLDGRLATKTSTVEYIGEASKLSMPIDEFLPEGDPGNERPRNVLRRLKVNTVDELTQKTEDDLLAVTNFGQKSLDNVKGKLAALGLQLKPI